MGTAMKAVPESDMEDKSSMRHSTTSSGCDDTSGRSCYAEEASKFSLAGSETTRINRSKFALFSVIVTVALLCSIVTYKIIRDQENREYHAKFHNIANEIAEFSQLRADYVVNNLERFGASLTSYARDQNMTWPFVAFPDFQVRGILSNKETGAHTVSINPLVYPKDLDNWSTFSANNQGWMAEAHVYDHVVHKELYELDYHETTYVHDETVRWNVTGITPYIWEYQKDPYAPRQRVSESVMYAPIWQRAPPCDYATQVNLDLRTYPAFTGFVDGMLAADHPVITTVVDATYLETNYDFRFDPAEQEEPHSYMLEPVYDTLTTNRTAVAFLSAFLRWGTFFTDVLPSTEQGIFVVLESSCNQTFTYELFGHKPVYLGEGNLHDTGLDSDKLEDTFEFAPDIAMEKDSGHEFCHYYAHIYPSTQWRDPFLTSNPLNYSIAVFACFLVTALGFVMYDVLVQRRQAMVMRSAAKTNAIVTSLFPANVRDRLLDDAETELNKAQHRASSTEAFMNDGRIKEGPDGTRNEYASEYIFGSKPIADLFPETTIMFGDLVGFTAWSSTREPAQVFTLLETLYHSFDNIAKRRRVFKVETVGDCYVAVCGLPDPRKEHATVMVKFATDCLTKMLALVRRMETSLGPDTGDLSMRIGLHSGPVTAGVLRGDKGRFQLFGDTMNTASRMETTGEPGRIHCSEETAEILMSAGRSKWLTQREDQVIAKGKGALTTYWLKLQSESHATGSNMTNNTQSSEGVGVDLPETAALNKALHLGGTSERLLAKPAFNKISSKEKRLVTWNVDILVKLLQQIMARRLSLGEAPAKLSRQVTTEMTKEPRNVLDEVEDVLALPQFDARTIRNQVDPKSIKVPEPAVQQLTEMVTQIAQLYQDNPFHSFEHASHVTMSVTKLMSRIVTYTSNNPASTTDTPSDTEVGDISESRIAAELHDHTFGITSDPLTQFACIISALIHDADHPGVPNSTLVKEEHPLASKYKNKSVAEQNSVDLAWRIVTNRDFKDLHACIYSSMDEFNRFRSIVVNVVMATDIMDKDLGTQRKARWNRAFAKESGELLLEEDPTEAINRKATIVLEHLMQASDVAHTMQHWVVYKKWNERLFEEMYKAFSEGHSDKDPSEGWYQGELGFFDYYIIPLAKKLETCGVFGVSSHEYLSYASANRREWAEKGEQIVKDYLNRYENKFGNRESWEDERSVDV
ncbi:Receptor-type guanylate cyclase gcy [Seminavis robusta]|uniref:Receptor-type guanylate cyclase gcy n=1 Tax=Seminavis robusta TaxID=568900 RepID=A0A9N8EPB7_9STRA|nr:Receptor-type guanylate cyclase gcy [Seminavis robusta]|eukprot:Sro1281_g258940.1 Receptor-type guanylate cyclase gcy (1202) ;mRNA; r:17282-21390